MSPHYGLASCFPLANIPENAYEIRDKFYLLLTQRRRVHEWGGDFEDKTFINKTIDAICSGENIP